MKTVRSELNRVDSSYSQSRASHSHRRFPGAGTDVCDRRTQQCNAALKQLLDAGLWVTINSDDPAYFGGYVAENFQEVQAALKLTQAEIHQLAQNSFQASFLTAEEKQLFLDELNAFMAQVF